MATDAGTRTTLLGWADALSKSAKPGDKAVATYILTHQERLMGWVRQFTNGMSRTDREEILQVLLLACVEAVRAPDAETALKNVHNAMQRTFRHSLSWRDRKRQLTEEN